MLMVSTNAAEFFLLGRRLWEPQDVQFQLKGLGWVIHKYVFCECKEW